MGERAEREGREERLRRRAIKMLRNIEKKDSDRVRERNIEKEDWTRRMSK